MKTKKLPIRSVVTVLLTVLMSITLNGVPVHAYDFGDIDGSVAVTADNEEGDKEIEFGTINSTGYDALTLTVKDGKKADIKVKSITSDKKGIFIDELT
ncbi:MAG: hypothetical protein IIZ33_07655, partial [Erysipelotrichaceae bacterium]|nr:hypothetical protein [Erysipelotrichaceae bacterium]